jgi:hypothetical protein
MNIIFSLHLQQHVSVDLYSHHQVVVKIHKKKSILGKGHPVEDTKYDIFVAWLLFQIME